MDPYEDVSSAECTRAARGYRCPYCGVQAGYKCRSRGGAAYNEKLRVHLDRLIAMWRDHYSDRLSSSDAWDAGYDYGLKSGWRNGVEDARYTFANTHVRQGARERDERSNHKEQGGDDASEAARKEHSRGARHLQPVP